ncbi:cob(I)yrinic acid a,c-diamide adenosyltransferase [Bdellovibrio sp. SKB1291214]|uniref:cob(I)yrinic acid a,c-diamide adenosyltransferase n=1 Tax=Bdellovibrio sp. SKB1291214 TaxID=1732569 RepID=UPI000B5159D4|nr:cob(I)yrinic acid a,c-diamide adenosyltransferase [Bdellovibrio sp. SKB1291214]UYL08428.1 cob(I)yrinic acid a,c-diamide adenosyltransferase [Bdellovibrio sp. SKB1291214]
MTTPPKAKIYTRTGDKGTTRLVDGSCVEKFNPRVEAYGTVDELNSYLGVCRSSFHTYPELLSLDGIFEKIQNELFNIGSLLATEKDEVFQMLPPITEEQIRRVEKKIDELTAGLPELRNFILPAGHIVASHIHVARTCCRRSERRAAEIAVKDDRYSMCLQYLNRLSDFLFVAARWVNLKMGQNEVLWKQT